MPRASRKIRKWTAALLDLPQDIVLDLPRVTLIGGNQVTIENHRGVIQFSPTLLRLAMEQGELEVAGEGLMIRTIGPEEVFVEGRIMRVELKPK
jgi:sporulation protein YqfC